DPGDFPSSMTVEADLDGDTWTGAVHDAFRGADLGSVRSVYYRRPSQFSLAEGMVGPEQRWASREARVGFGGVLLAPDCWWIARPSDRKSTRLNSVTVRSRMASSALKKKSSQ